MFDDTLPELTYKTPWQRVKADEKKGQQLVRMKGTKGHDRKRVEEKKILKKEYERGVDGGEGKIEEKESNKDRRERQKERERERDREREDIL